MELVTKLPEGFLGAKLSAVRIGVINIELVAVAHHFVDPVQRRRCRPAVASGSPASLDYDCASDCGRRAARALAIAPSARDARGHNRCP